MAAFQWNLPEEERRLEEVLEGFGRDIPLDLALRQIIPADRSYSLVDGVSPDIVVSWQGGRPWPEILEEMLASRGLDYRERDGQIVIFPSNAKAGQPLALTSRPAADAPADQASTGSAANEPVGEGEWRIEKGQWLYQTLSSWAEKAGWTVEWNMPRDFLLAHGAVFQGDFVSVAREILSHYADADPPLEAHFYRGNRVLLVKERGAS